jgi:hypothetical protein
MVVAGKHMLSPQIQERHELHTGDFLNVAFITLGNTMGMSKANEK